LGPLQKEIVRKGMKFGLRLGQIFKMLLGVLVCDDNVKYLSLSTTEWELFKIRESYTK
jgi:hypothetical protein